MKMISAVLLGFAAVMSISATSQAGILLTATGRTSIDGCKRWENTTPEEREFVRTDAAAYAKTEMENGCLVFGPDYTPVVLETTVTGTKCATLAQAQLYVLEVSYTCTK